VVVQLCEADVLVWQEPQLLDGGRDARRARRDAFEQLTKPLFVDGNASLEMCFDYSSGLREPGAAT